MSLLVAISYLIARVPWQVWCIVLVLGGVAAWGWHQKREGERAAEQRYERQQTEAAEAARKEVDRLRGGADRSRVQRFDRD